ncbi:hypothetical protein DLJ88_08885 [Evtepia gabavorous]|uniref:Uncharacterized protein n=1 Tax=Evtepia gabavorous TaxID=2211183 RepID=A0A3E2B2A7_9FIRM|nr:hypothetical protein DV520_08885 [Evtepia gabavorous]TYK62340.1 hypothetical protein DLJ88_08885 [Evtepia gabavorous]
MMQKLVGVAVVAVVHGRRHNPSLKILLFHYMVCREQCQEENFRRFGKGNGPAILHTRLGKMAPIVAENVCRIKRKQTISGVATVGGVW